MLISEVKLKGVGMSHLPLLSVENFGEGRRCTALSCNEHGNWWSS